MRPTFASIFKLFLALSLLLSSEAHAGLANPEPQPTRQGDGSMFWRILRGDEHDSRFETLEGYTILDMDGVWVFATLDEHGMLAPTDWLVNQVDPTLTGLMPHLSNLHRPTPPARTPPPILLAPDRPSATFGAPTLGTVKHLVILAAFSDHWDYSRNTIHPNFGFSQARYDALMNERGHAFDGAQGSVADYFDEVSNGQFRLSSIVTVWVRLPDREQAYANSDGNGRDDGGRLVRDSLAALEATGFDFTSTDTNGDSWVDVLTIIHSGWDAADGGNGQLNHVWSHASMTGKRTYDGINASRYTTISALRGPVGTLAISRIGTACHEIGHFLGIRDYYDTDGPIGGDGEGLGNWSVMSGSGWLGAGTRPGPFDAYTRTLLGWVSPLRVHSLPASSGYAFNLPPSSSTTGGILRIDDGFADGEYLLVEHYGNHGRFSQFPASEGLAQGIAIWHIDESNDDNNASSTPQNARVRLVEADGNQSLLSAPTSRSQPRDVWNPAVGDTKLSLTHPSGGAKRNDGGNPGVELTLAGTPGTSLSVSPETRIPWLMQLDSSRVGPSEPISLLWGKARDAARYLIDEGQQVSQSRYLDDAENRERFSSDWEARGSWQRYDHRNRNVGGAADGHFSYAAIATSWTSDLAPTLIPATRWRNGQFLLTFKRPVFITDSTIIRWQEKRVLEASAGDYLRLQIRYWEGGPWHTIYRREDSSFLFWTNESVSGVALSSFRRQWVQIRFEIVIENMTTNLFWPHAGVAIDRFSLENVTLFTPSFTPIAEVDADTTELELIAPMTEGQRLYRVRPVSAEGVPGPASNSVDITVTTAVDRTAPNAVRDLRMTDSTPESLTLELTACGDDGGNGMANIEIRRSESVITEDNFGNATLEATLTNLPGGQTGSLTIDGLEPYSTHFIAARCGDEANNLGPLSNILLASTPNLPPEPPTLRLPVDGALVLRSPTLHWDNGERTADPISNSLYSVVVVLSSNRAAIEAGDPSTIVLMTDALETTHSPLNLQPNTDYYWRVYNANASGYVTSPIQSFRTRGGDTSPPAKVNDLRIDQISGVSCLLLWTAPGDDSQSGTATRYDLRVSRAEITAANFDFAEPIPTPSPITAGGEDGVYLIGLAPSTNYWVALRTEDEIPNIAPISNIATFKTASVVAPAAPSNPSPGDGETVLEGASTILQWQNGARTGDPSYVNRSQVEVFMSTSRERVETMARGDHPDHPSALVAEGPATLQSFTSSPLVAGQTWYWRVVDRNAGGATPGPVWSFRVEAADTSPPSKISDLRVTSVGDHTATLSWTAPGDDADDGRATSYELRLARVPFGEGHDARVDDAEVVFGLPSPLDAGTSSSFTLDSLESGTRYWVALTSADEVGQYAPFSAILDFETTGGPTDDVGPDVTETPDAADEDPVADISDPESPADTHATADTAETTGANDSSEPPDTFAGDSPSETSEDTFPPTEDASPTKKSKQGGCSGGGTKPGFLLFILLVALLSLNSKRKA
jgi:M6 family metalloprotease-like protein